MSSLLPLVYIIGDSISIQYGHYLRKYLAGGWRYDRKEGEAEALLNLDNPTGSNGGDSSMVLAFLRAIFATNDFHPDLLLINCGAHDIKTDPITKIIQIPLIDYRNNLQEIVRLCSDHKVTMAWIQSTPLSEEIHNVRHNMGFHRYTKDRLAYNEAACQIMVAAAIPLIDLCGFTSNLGTEEELFCDHAHFHEAVREKQAAFLTGWLQAWKTFRSQRAYSQ